MNTPDRTVQGLTPRRRPRPDAGALIRENRPIAPADDATATPGQQAPTSVPPRSQPDPRPRTKKTPHARGEDAKPPRSQIAVDLPTELRERARTAYRAAALYEDVPSFAAFVAQAIETEIRRIEAAYNDGEQFQGRTARLPAGRPPES